MLGIIGGSGWDTCESLNLRDQIAVDTAWGTPSGYISRGEFAGRPLAFISRHGPDHRLAPHEVNYRANIAALRQVGVSRILALTAVGAIADGLMPGDLVVPHQLIDYTWGREQSFREPGTAPVVHPDFTEPFDAGMRRILLRNSGGLEDLRDGGVYAVAQGPRFETAAEIDRMARDGCTLVGMTAMPEAYLAREVGTPYAVISIVANRAAGRGPGVITQQGVERVLKDSFSKLLRLLNKVVPAGL